MSSAAHLSNDSSNGTCSKSPSNGNSALILIFTLISVVSIVINTLIIILYSRKQFTLLVNRPSSRLLFSLAICDLLSALGLVAITVLLLNKDIHGYAFRIVLDVYETFLVKTVVCHLCGLTLDRYLGLFYALRYQAIVTNENVKRYILISWLISFVASGVQLIWLYKKMILPKKPKLDDTEPELNRTEFLFSLISFVIFLALPTILLAVVFSRMIVEIQRIVKRTPGRTLRARPSKTLVNERRSTYIYSLMYLTFVLLAMPYYSYRLRHDIKLYLSEKMQKCPDRGVLIVERLVVILKYSTSIIRPALYAFTSVELRAAAFQLRDKILHGERYSEYSITFHRGHLRAPTLEGSGSTNSFESKDELPSSHVSLQRTIGRKDYIRK